MTRRALLLFAFTAGSLALGLAPARADVLSDAKAAGVLKVGTETEFAPFDYIDGDKHVGFNVDFFDEVGKSLGMKIEWVALPWDGVLPGLESSKFDIVAGPAIITKARMQRYTFSSPIGEGTVTLVKRASDASIQKPTDIAGRSVGGGRGSNQLVQLKELAASVSPPATVREYTGANETQADMAAGRIVASAMSLPNALAAAKRRPDMFAVVLPPFGVKAYFGYIGRKDAASASLMQAVDAQVAAMKTDGRMAKLQQKWFGATTELPASVTDPAS
ncbi:transporter substrate-binding domain-containing protein [Acidisphaera sp. L21]|uniref:transporter substrate-binding domain-containing protein n=1 Tax=Acidisphaera sp. L21 TaxID=1641851 RepID=UPI00131DE4DB|nr:transporter substrate-binding domain-containing protein [Acidisphaera sp. L21]